MAHYAFLNENNIVTEVIVGRNEDEIVDGISDWEAYYANFRGQRCVRTSYNHNIRKQFAGIGYTYDSVRDEFVKPKPFPSWTLDENNDWQSPVPRPDWEHFWSEETLSWVPNSETATEPTDEFID
jgi:hypothetical protein